MRAAGVSILTAGKERIRTGLIFGLTIGASLLILSGFLHSMRGLYECLDQVRAIRDTDVRALSVEGDMQDRIQESRRRFLEALMSDAESRTTEIDEARRADLQVDLLKARVIVLTGNAARFRTFEDAWGKYSETRDDVIALALQGRSAEARALEGSVGRAAFAAASDAVRRDKVDLEASCRRKTGSVSEALKDACSEALGLLFARVLFLAALLSIEYMRRRMVRKLQAANETLRGSEQRFRGAFQEASVGILLLDPEGRVVSSNRAIAEITGYSSADLNGQRASVLLAESDREEAVNSFAAVAGGRTPGYRAERRIVLKDGRSGWIRVSVSLVGQGGAPKEVIVLCEDITEQKRASERLAFQAMHDSLTGLANRRHFVEVLDREVETARRSQTDLALLYLDLDGFRMVDDTLGHAAGDALLTQVAARLRERLCPEDFPARLGRDEFAVLRKVGDKTSEALADLARALLAALEQPFRIDGNELNINASVGISRFPADAAGARALLRGADAAMYHAKRNRSEGFCFFDGPLKEAATRRQAIEANLRKALERREFRVHYQPVYDVACGSLIGFEALCRWWTPELGEVSPAEFIPVAEDTGLICALGRWVLDRACSEARRWHEHGGSPIRIAVNVSATQLADSGFVESVREILDAARFPPQLLELELTESTLVVDREGSVSRMQRLREMGISISMDDFGTGYSSLGYLQTMPIDALKIDRSFTMRLDSSPAAVSMIRSVISMGRSLGLRVVTEGVETAAQLETLRRLGSDEAQGYYLGRPEDADAAFRRVLAATSVEPALV
jgi:diguanylate cyclase (GGDEF)-like protein/PAS domain S-box-containing protein